MIEVDATGILGLQECKEMIGNLPLLDISNNTIPSTTLSCHLYQRWRNLILWHRVIVPLGCLIGRMLLTDHLEDSLLVICRGLLSVWLFNIADQALNLQETPFSFSGFKIPS